MYLRRFIRLPWDFLLLATNPSSVSAGTSSFATRLRLSPRITRPRWRRCRNWRLMKMCFLAAWIPHWAPCRGIHQKTFCPNRSLSTPQSSTPMDSYPAKEYVRPWWYLWAVEPSGSIRNSRQWTKQRSRASDNEIAHNEFSIIARVHSAMRRYQVIGATFATMKKSWWCSIN